MNEEPEYITILEGPTPNFQSDSHLWMKSVYEGPAGSTVAQCELRTANGEDIADRSPRAWRERRPVRLDFPDELRMRKEVDVVGLRLRERDEGTVLKLWVRWPLEEEDEEESEYDD